MLNSEGEELAVIPEAGGIHIDCTGVLDGREGGKRRETRHFGVVDVVRCSEAIWSI